MQPASYRELRERLTEVHNLDRASAVLTWDERTKMPPGGAAARADQFATLVRVKHYRMAADEVGRLLSELSSYEESLPHDSTEASLIRVARRDHEKARRVPPDLEADLARAPSTGEHAWREARDRNDYRAAAATPAAQRRAAPALRGLLPRRGGPLRRAARRLRARDEDGGHGAPARRAEARAAATHRRGAGALPRSRRLIPLQPLRRRSASGRSCWRSCSGCRSRPAPGAWTTPRTRSRPPSPPPTCASRPVTATRTCRTAVFCGAARDGARPVRERRERRHDAHPAVPPGLARHARVAEPHMGEPGRAQPRRSGGASTEWLPTRSPGSWRASAPTTSTARSTRSAARWCEPRRTSSPTTCTCWCGSSSSAPSSPAGSTSPTCPRRGTSACSEYLGVDVPADSAGVLQDVHWAEGLFGYFPTYSLGNIIAGQLWEAAHEALPGLEEGIERGELRPLRDWLREHVHRHGRKLESAEIVERATGRPIEIGPYVRYLTQEVRRDLRARGGTAACPGEPLAARHPLAPAMPGAVVFAAMPRAQTNGIELEYETLWRSVEAHRAADHGARGADAGLGRALLQLARRPWLPRRPVRQPRHRPLDEDRGRAGAEPARADGRATTRARATRSTTWPTTRPGCSTRSTSTPRTWWACRWAA